MQVQFSTMMMLIRCRLQLCPRLRWGAYSALPDSLAAFKGPTSRTSREQEGGKGMGGSPGSSDFPPPNVGVLE